MALWINDLGQAVGASGSCANTVLPPLALGPHAVLWERDGSVTNLGNLGGTAVPAIIEKILDLLKLAAGRSAQLRKTAPQVVRGNSGYPGRRCVLPQELPDDLLGQPFATDLTAAVDGPEYLTFGGPSRRGPGINGDLQGGDATPTERI
jgi:hypothetical protein